MSGGAAVDDLKGAHAPEAVRKRLSVLPPRTYLRDFVFGAVDGAVTTFAIVSGVAGAGLSPGIVIIFGMANLIADGFSMAVGNYLAARADRELFEKARRVEELHIQMVPEGEREEVRQIFAKKGFAGADLENAVSLVTSNRREWIDTMMREELRMSMNPASPIRAALSTLAAFTSVGFVPVLPFVAEQIFPSLPVSPFAASVVLTGAAFFLTGVLKARVTGQKWHRSGLETLLLGGLAALLAFFAGRLLGGLGNA